jgi:hypothetical protein
VTSVDNRIGLTPRESAAGTQVNLSGTARSWAQRRQVALAAWSSPNVAEVYNHIVVRSG